MRLPNDTRAPLLARAFVRKNLCESHSRETRDEVELLVSELVTNAVLHGGSLVTMDLDCEAPEGIAVEVSDSSSTRPVARHPGPLEEGGRGMELVELISDAWGVRDAGAAAPAPPRLPDQVPGAMPRQSPGKVVWFRLAG